jgi:hypothetical protein
LVFIEMDMTMNSHDYYRDQYMQRYGQTATQKLTDVDDFCRRYDAKITNSEHRRARREAVPNWSMDYTKYSPVEYRVEYEQLVALHMPRESLDRLLALEPKLEYTHDQLNRYARKDQDEYKDAQIRQNNPAVKRAWENYCTLLALCR